MLCLSGSSGFRGSVAKACASRPVWNCERSIMQAGHTVAKVDSDVHRNQICMTCRDTYPRACFMATACRSDSGAHHYQLRQRYVHASPFGPCICMVSLPTAGSEMQIRLLFDKHALLSACRKFSHCCCQLQPLPETIGHM